MLLETSVTCAVSAALQHGILKNYWTSHVCTMDTVLSIMLFDIYPVQHQRSATQNAIEHQTCAVTAQCYTECY